MFLIELQVLFLLLPVKDDKSKIKVSDDKMFLENSKQGKRKGWIEVICGSMFSGKTEELIRRLKRAYIAQQKVEIFKPSLDKRYHEKDIVSHDAHTIQSTPVESSSQILLLIGEVDVVAIDEAQFFDDELSNV